MQYNFKIRGRRVFLCAPISFFFITRTLTHTLLLHSLYTHAHHRTCARPLYTHSHTFRQASDDSYVLVPHILQCAAPISLSFSPHERENVFSVNQREPLLRDQGQQMFLRIGGRRRRLRGIILCVCVSAAGLAGLGWKGSPPAALLSMSFRRDSFPPPLFVYVRGASILIG